MKTLRRMAEGWISKYGEKSIASSLVLAGSFALLLALQAGADIMLSLANFLLDASFLNAALKTLKSILQGFILLDPNFRH